MNESSLTQREITQGSITRVLVVGFSLVIILLSFGGVVAIRNISSIQENAAKLVSEQSVTRRLIEGLEQEQSTLSAIFYTLTGDPDTADEEQIEKRLLDVQAQIHKMAEHPEGGFHQRELWGDLEQSSTAFTAEARRLMSAASTADHKSLDKTTPDNASRDLFRRHEKVIEVISRLVALGFNHVSDAQAAIDKTSQGLAKESLSLLGASLALALICSIFTVRLTRDLFRSMAWQEGELTRVSWHMLADQESIARRFSHELHDELGQTLAALKANLVALAQNPANPKRVVDSANLTDEAIRNVRSLSQLLRPIILDDFGLDAGLRWLCEGFTQRTSITVNFHSNLEQRLPDETETHLFRIAQEALTNVARHSGATRVQVRLDVEKAVIRLTLEDNGKGMKTTGKTADISTQSLGMTGMRARARAVGGIFRVESPRSGGLKVQAEIPLPESERRQPNEPHTNFAR